MRRNAANKSLTLHHGHPMKIIVFLILTAILPAGPASAKRPQVVPEPMLVNLFALTEASAALKICADSPSYAGLTANEQALLQRLQGAIERLVQTIAHKYDDDLFPFFLQTRQDAAARPDKIAEMRAKYRFCGNDLLAQMNRYVTDSRQKLDYFLSQQPDAK